MTSGGWMQDFSVLNIFLLVLGCGLAGFATLANYDLLVK